MSDFNIRVGQLRRACGSLSETASLESARQTSSSPESNRLARLVSAGETVLESITFEIKAFN